MKQPRKAKRRGRWLLVVLMLAVLTTAAGWYYINYYAVAAEPAEPALQTAKVRVGDITITASGSGNLLPASELGLAFRSGGLLAEMLVQVGDEVQVGEVLARLDDSDARAQVAPAEANLRLAELKLAELTQDADPAALASARATIAAAQADLSKLLAPPSDQEVLAARENLSSARETLALLQAGPNPENVEIAKANLTLAEINLRTAQTAYDKVPPVTEKRDGSTVGAGESKEAADLWQATTNYEKAKAEYEESLAGPTADDLAAARSKVALAQAQVDAQLAEPDPDAVAAAEAKLTQAQAQLDAVLAGTSAGDLEAAEVSVNLARYSLVLAQAGEPVGTAPILTLADLETPMVRFWVEETDLISVALGNPVEVVFEALPNYVYPGEITRVDPALVTVDGTPAVQAWASIDLTTHPVSLLSGMTAEVTIISGETTDALLVPVQALRELAPGSYAVFVVNPNGELEVRPVTVGLMDFANAEVLTGLERGEVVSTGTVDTE
jgi:multidrug efflux pump subunit AcrA (membrane-fusion protein)